ncbi:Uncharacterised protein [Streptococcus pneumoniae]|nr:Uncharacterised protein [Streptococcus pneumoniae]CJM85127.1 Uncharacterised protein [Streptococcus pneumoniae]CJO32115.1 Uncharacterised protein [Streptococcus pneumoniae]CJR14592.1 Uncharacterised protein [Streptococcus pneumoniae]CJW41704.1 Uncharacterised protein [Streptococcus pneumoniae]
MRMLPILLLFLALLPFFSKFVTGGSSFSWEVFLTFPKFQVEVSHPKEIHLATCSPSIF